MLKRPRSYVTQTAEQTPVRATGPPGLATLFSVGHSELPTWVRGKSTVRPVAENAFSGKIDSLKSHSRVIINFYYLNEDSPRKSYKGYKGRVLSIE